VDEDLLGSFRLGAFGGPFSELAVDEGRSGANQADEVGALTARQRSWADSMSLRAIASRAAREPDPLVTLVRYPTVAKVDQYRVCRTQMHLTLLTCQAAKASGSAVQQQSAATRPTYI
jgi:hypothetical protein